MRGATGQIYHRCSVGGARALRGPPIAAEFRRLQNEAAIDDERLAEFRMPIRSHHERIDGRGYPDQLHAGELDLATRIVSVADSFNAMIGRRPYRAPMLPAQALEQLAANRDKQFDREIVAAMFEVVREL